MSNENVGFQENKSREQLAVLLDPLIEHIFYVIILKGPRLTNRLRVEEVMIDTSNGRNIINASVFSNILCGYEGLIKRNFYVICFKFIIKGRIL